ncbi:MAG TPA: ATP-binding cassette domain-containing protein [Candidatus Eisenbacteria bacterium]
MPLHIQNLTKTYANGTQALKDITLTIPTGLTVIAGPTGAGKSTLLRILATLQEPDRGSVHLNGIDILNRREAACRSIAWLSHDPGVHPSLSPWERLDHVALRSGIIDDRLRKATVEQLLRKTDLWEQRNRPMTDDAHAHTLATQRRLALAVTLIGSPALILVDEPATALDPTERTPFLELLTELAEDRIVLIAATTTHSLTGPRPRMAIMDRGELRQIVEPPSFTSAPTALFPYPSHRSVPIIRA